MGYCTQLKSLHVTTVSSSATLLHGGMINEAPYEINDKGDRVACRIALSPRVQPYLADHMLNGKIVLPMACGINIVGEVAAAAFPDFLIDEIANFRVLSGLVFNSMDDHREIIVELTLSDDRSTIFANAFSETPKRKPHFKCEIRTRSEDHAIPKLTVKSGELLDLNEIYGVWLFHGPIFQGISTASIIDNTTIVGSVCGVQPLLLLSRFNPYYWYLDPIAVDSAMQLAAILVRSKLDLMVLPDGFERLSIYKYIGQQQLKVLVKFKTNIAATDLHCDLYAYDEADEPVFAYHDLSGTGIRLKTT